MSEANVIGLLVVSSLTVGQPNVSRRVEGRGDLSMNWRSPAQFGQASSLKQQNTKFRNKKTNPRKNTSDSRTNDIKPKPNEPVMDQITSPSNFNFPKIADSDEIHPSETSRLPAPLDYSWTFWYDIQPSRGLDKEHYEEQLHQAASFHTIPDFWKGWNQVLQVSPTLESNVRIFKSGVKPLWEDPSNVNGGKWVAITPKTKNQQRTIQAWLSLLITILVGELGFEDDITGMGLSVRNWGNMFTIWNTDCTKKEEIEEVTRKFAEMLGTSNVKYHPHQKILKSRRTRPMRNFNNSLSSSASSSDEDLSKADKMLLKQLTKEANLARKNARKETQPQSEEGKKRRRRRRSHKKRQPEGAVANQNISDESAESSMESSTDASTEASTESSVDAYYEYVAGDPHLDDIRNDPELDEPEEEIIPPQIEQEVMQELKSIAISKSICSYSSLAMGILCGVCGVICGVGLVQYGL